MPLNRIMDRIEDPLEAASLRIHKSLMARQKRLVTLSHQACLYDEPRVVMGNFLKPVGIKFVGLYSPNFAVIGDHVFVGDRVAELPTDPILEIFWRFRRARRLHTTCQVVDPLFER